MKQRLLALLVGLALAALVVAGTTGCASESIAVGQTATRQVTTAVSTSATAGSTTSASEDTASSADATTGATTSAADTGTDSDTASTDFLSSVEGSILDVTEMFTERDMDQSPDLEGATYITLQDGATATITEEGTYVLSGDVSNATVEIDAADDAKVQLVLDGVGIVNDSAPAISVISADKVFVTLTDSTNHLEVSGADAETGLDAVILSRSDLVLNGTGSLEIVSGAGNGISAKDDLVMTGGTYSITSAADGIEANDSIRILDGDITIVSAKDALHAENDEDLSLGYIYIAGGTFSITAGDDGIQGNAIVQIDGGVIDIEECAEGIEGTYVQINGGEIDIYATDDGINATAKSDYDVVLEINGGTISVDMAGGDTDALDSNGDLYINGGTIALTGGSLFDYMGVGELNGGEVTANGEAVTQLTQSQMGGMPGGGRPGGR